MFSCLSLNNSHLAEDGHTGSKLAIWVPGGTADTTHEVPLRNSMGGEGRPPHRESFAIYVLGTYTCRSHTIHPRAPHWGGEEELQGSARKPMADAVQEPEGMGKGILVCYGSSVPLGPSLLIWECYRLLKGDLWWERGAISKAEKSGHKEYPVFQSSVVLLRPLACPTTLLVE